MTTLDARLLSDEDLAAVVGGRMHLIGPPPPLPPGEVLGSNPDKGFPFGDLVLAIGRIGAGLRNLLGGYASV